MSAICQQCHRLDKYCACNVSLSPLTEQPRAAEQPVTHGINAVPQVPEYAVTNGQWSQPTHPPAGDVVERELWVIKYDDAEVEDEIFLGEGAEIAALQTYKARLANWNCHLLVSYKRMTAALAIAREGYVSLEERDAQWEKTIRIEATRVLYGPKAAETFITSVRNRLAKPAERTVIVDCDAVDQWYVALDRTPLNVKFTNKRDAERYATGLREELRDGKEGK